MIDRMVRKKSNNGTSKPKIYLIFRVPKPTLKQRLKNDQCYAQKGRFCFLCKKKLHLKVINHAGLIEMQNIHFALKW